MIALTTANGVIRHQMALQGSLMPYDAKFGVK